LRIPLNIEARVNSVGTHYIMEIGPRNGGHFVPQAIQYATGFNMVKASLDVFTGGKIKIPNQRRSFSAYYAIHSDFDGELIHLTFDKKLESFVKEFHQYISPGERVKSFTGANAAIGILLLSFDNREEMETTIDCIQSLINLRIKTHAGRR
jgi:biotin carboxylase